VLLSFTHSFVIFIFAWYGSGGCSTAACQSGQTTYMGGHLTTLLVTTAVTIKVASEFARFYWWTWFFLIMSILAYPVLMLAYTSQTWFDFGVPGDALQQFWVSQVGFSFGTTWLSIICVSTIVGLMDVGIKGYWRHFQTTFAHLVQEAESKGTVWLFSSGLPTQDSLAVQEEGKSQVQPSQISKDPFIQLDRLNDALWSLEKSGQLVIPGPSLPSFDGGDNSENALLGGAAGDEGLSSRDDRSSSQIELSLAAGKKNEDGLTGRNSEVKRKTSVLERATANNGMSMDHHAAHEGANSFRQQISASEQ
jgi:hypothetical protein